MVRNMGTNIFEIVLDSGCPSGDGYSCYVFISKYSLTEKETIEKLVLLNALVPVSDKPAIIISIPINVEEARGLIKRAQNVESYIGHEATAKLLAMLFEREIPMSRAMYQPRNEDLALIVRLRKRLEKPEDVKNIRPEDLELLLVRYYTNVYVVEHK
jgi:hypothetical protein